MDVARHEARQHDVVRGIVARRTPSGSGSDDAAGHGEVTSMTVGMDDVG